MGKIVSLENVMLLKQLFPPEQFAALSHPTKYHEDLEAKFYLMRYPVSWLLSLRC